MLLKLIGLGLIVFAVVFLALRGLEALYHRFRRTPDYSAHWGTWVFALLCAVGAVVANLGR